METVDKTTESGSFVTKTLARDAQACTCSTVFARARFAELQRSVKRIYAVIICSPFDLKIHKFFSGNSGGEPLPKCGATSLHTNARGARRRRARHQDLQKSAEPARWPPWRSVPRPSARRARAPTPHSPAALRMRRAAAAANRQVCRARARAAGPPRRRGRPNGPRPALHAG